MTNDTLSRRTFLDSSLAAAVAAALPRLPLDIGQEGQADCKIRIRRSIQSLAPDGPELTAYRKAINIMRSRPAADPTSWVFQARIHEYFDSADTNPADDDGTWSTCQHGQFWFLPWHRMYLYQFERIVRAASGDDNFALPYWNYSDPNQRTVPSAFTDPNPNNELYTENRVNGINLSDFIDADSDPVSLNALNQPSFTGSSPLYGFGSGTSTVLNHNGSRRGRVERVPHDSVHGLVGGEGGWLAAFDTAPLDPLFWLHHANIDRLWKRWLALGGGRANPTSTGWLDLPMGFYTDTGQLVSMTTRQVLRTESLNYRYDDDPINLFASTLWMIRCRPHIFTTFKRLTLRQYEILKALGTMPPLPKPRALLTQITQELTLGRTATSTTLPGSAKALTTVTALRSMKEKPPVIILRLTDVSAEKAVGGYYKIYIGRAAPSKDGTGAEFVGLLTLFGREKHSKQHAAGQDSDGEAFDVTEAMINLARTNSKSEDLVVTFVPKLTVSDKMKNRPGTQSVARIGGVTLEVR
jgi:hypothetical protein